MIEPLETPTFVIDDFSDSRDIRFFDYLTHENIPFEILELCSSELPYRDIVYYPVILTHVTDNTDIFENVNCRALQKAQDNELTIVFIYDGFDDVTRSAYALLTQLFEHNLSMADVRFITQIKPACDNYPFVYFSFAEIETHMAAFEDDYVETIQEGERDNIATLQVSNDTAHARLFCGALWYHALNNYNYFSYGAATCDVMHSPIYTWDEHWQATGTLLDMFGQQLPIACKENNKLKHFNNAYWNLNVQPNFHAGGLSLGPQLFEPILNMQPFIIIGSAYSAKLLRSLGYKTFSNDVNENYDAEDNDESRMQTLFRLAYDMCYWTSDELLELSKKLHPIIRHNQQHLLSSKKFRLLTLLHELKTDNTV